MVVVVTGDPWEYPPVLPDPVPAVEAFWRAVHSTVRAGRPFPVDFALVAEMARYTGIVRSSAPIAI